MARHGLEKVSNIVGDRVSTEEPRRKTDRT